ncbi:hypothetical protein X777_06284 [Ooceraea biroi]|uniref:Uncharacterized protein n=1 Tax=Ooceraea biroi TaxID=2015173 RepID=A0A026WAX1_OOCBI|nr:hypothetical protein X777_06284 [Ooceraea biroi]
MSLKQTAGVIDRYRAVEAASLAADGHRGDERATRFREARRRDVDGRSPEMAGLTSLFSCASADLNVRLIHSFTSKLSSENAETS